MNWSSIKQFKRKNCYFQYRFPRTHLLEVQPFSPLGEYSVGRDMIFDGSFKLLFYALYWKIECTIIDWIERWPCMCGRTAHFSFIFPSILQLLSMVNGQVQVWLRAIFTIQWGSASNLRCTRRISRESWQRWHYEQFNSLNMAISQALLSYLIIWHLPNRVTPTGNTTEHSHSIWIQWICVW